MEEFPKWWKGLKKELEEDIESFPQSLNS